jgi:two-component system sensor histidine kinase VicK
MDNKSTPNTYSYFKELSDNIPQVIFAYHVQASQLTYLSASFEQVWGKSIESAKVDPSALIATIHPEDRDYLKRCYEQLLEGEKKTSIEFRIITEAGDIRWLCLTGLVLIKEAGNKHVLTGLIEDISDVKQAHALLERFAAKKDSVLEILSHDLAGPLGNIKGMAALMKDEIKEYRNTELEKMLSMITRTSERSIKLIREFVKQEFLASANSALAKTRVNIVYKIKESIDQYKMSEKDISKVFNFTFSDEEIFVEVDDYKFVQVINNLISNSIKFTHDGGVISVGIEDREKHVLITVADNGIGIPDKYHDTLFEKFNKARRPGLKGEPSVGLGMSIIKAIVDWHGGKIWFKSRENEGTTFYIELPRE